MKTVTHLPDGILWETDKREVAEMMATKRGSAPGLCRCISQRQPLLDLPRSRQGGVAKVHLSIPAVYSCKKHYRGPWPFWLKAISCSNVHGVFLVREPFWSFLVQVFTTQFCSSPPVLMASVDDGSDVPISPLLGTSSNYGSPNGSRPDLDGMGHRSIDAQFKELRDISLPLARGFADFDNHVKTLSEAVGMVTSELPVLNRPSVPSLPRWRRLQYWNRTSAFLQKMSTPSLHAFAKLKRMQLLVPVALTRQDLGTRPDRVTAPQPLGPSGPMSQGHLMTERIVDLILSLIPKTNRHEVPSYCDSHVNSTTLGLRIGSITFGKIKHSSL